ncbi:MAG: hypothetical protein ACI9LM_003409 [Alteromonadaceae bacterium]
MLLNFQMHLKPIKFICTIMLSLAIALILTDLNSVSKKSPSSVAKSYSILLDVVQKIHVELPLITSHQASHFNHSQQRKIDYIFVVLLALFIYIISFIYQKITAVRLPPWFCLLKHPAKSRVSGWKESNLLYKAKLTYLN